MSGTYSNFMPWEIQQPGWDDWNEWQPYLRDSRPAQRSQIHRAPQWMLEDRPTRRPSGSVSFLSPVPPYSPQRPPLTEYGIAQNYYPTFRQPEPDFPPPWFYQQQYSPPSEPVSRFTKEEEEKCLKKLRKVMYNPHLSNIVRRMGMKNKTDGANQSGQSGNFQDDDAKRCPICLEDFDSKQFVMLSPCDHMFHEDCIVPWVKSQGKCPVCRFVICKQ